MSTLKNTLANQLKEKIHENPVQHLNLLFDLLPENSPQAEMILQLMDELVREKKLDRHLLYKHMEEPLYFQDESGQDFHRRDPLIAKLVREGGLSILNHYLNYKYGSPLTAELMALHDIFVFSLPPIKQVIDQTKSAVFADKEIKARINRKYYAVYGMSYELFGDILQDKHMSILKRLAECKFDFNQPGMLEHLKKYLYIHRDAPLQIQDETLQFLLDHGLKPESYLELFLTGLWDEFSLPHATKTQYPLIHWANFLLDHGATLNAFPREFLEKLQHTLALSAGQIDLLPQSLQQLQTLEEIWYLQGQFIETLTSLAQAKPYYFKAGKRGAATVQRKELINLLAKVKSLSQDNRVC